MDLQSDAALTDPANDALGRRGFAKTLANAIAEMDADTGFVFSLQGDWGSGKTTVINFVLHELRERSSPPTIVAFNPWWFSGRDQLIQQFFNALRAELGGDSTAAQAGTLAADLDKFARVLTPLTFVPALADPVRGIRTFISGVSESGKAIAETIAADAQQLRGEIDKKLRSRGGRILVVLDDLDRLPASELRQMFQLVKAVADFPNTIYLLAYDHSVVAGALDQEQGGKGSQYLAKIVQSPFDLPPPSRSALDTLLLKQLNVIIAGTPDRLFDQVRWGNLFFDGIQELIRSPRDVKRLLNAVRPAYPSIMEEVAADEFVAVQALRVFAPSLYSKVAMSKSLLAGGVETSRLGMDQQGALKPKCDEILELAPELDRNAVASIMSRLFPKWRYAYGDSALGPDWLGDWRVAGRVCSPDVFDLYFSLSLLEETIGLREFRDLIDASEHPTALAAELVEMAEVELPGGRTRSRLFLEGIQDFTESEVPEARVRDLLMALWTAGDRLLVPDADRGMFDLGDEMQVIRITHQLLKRLETSEDRYEALRAAIEVGTALQLATHEVSVRYQGLDKHSSDVANLIERKHVDLLRDVVLRQIEAAADDGRLAALHDLGYVLHRWREWADNDSIEFASRIAGTDEGFISLVKAFSGKVRSAEVSDRVSRSTIRVGVDALEEFTGMTESELQGRASDALGSLTVEADSDLRESLEILASGRGSRRGHDDF